VSRVEARRWEGQQLPMYPSFRTAWQMAARPCITFPLPSLQFRTVGFPQYGYKPESSRDLRPGIRRGLYTTLAHPPDHRGSASVCDGVGQPGRRIQPRGPWLASRLCCPARSSLTMASSEALGPSRRFPLSVYGGSLPLAAGSQSVPVFLCMSFWPCRLPYPGGPDGTDC
jgi:hypothetical protein